MAVITLKLDLQTKLDFPIKQRLSIEKTFKMDKNSKISTKYFTVVFIETLKMYTHLYQQQDDTQHVFEGTF